MMPNNCEDKIVQSCTTPIYAPCVRYEGIVNTQSTLIDKGCRNLHQTTEDIYTQLEQVEKEIDLSALGKSCLTYIQDNNKNIVKNVLLKYEQEICDLKTKVANLQTVAICSTSIMDCGIDFKCLFPVNPCGTRALTIKDFMVAVVAKLCP
jgi:hypothetical protein